jgi:putative two-component system response regulator
MKKIINNKNQIASLEIIADLIELRDKYTGGHVLRTSAYLKVLTNELKKQNKYQNEMSILGDEWNMDIFLSSAQVHDIGKVGISDKILNKCRNFTQENREMMETHVKLGADTIERIRNITGDDTFLYHTFRIVLFHHERWDGKGYPAKLKGINIPLEGRLMAIADTYDAIVSTRPYRKAKTHKKACEIIESGAGTQFDPVLVEIFKSVKSEFKKIKDENTSKLT